VTELIGQIPPLAETETPPAARTANADIRMRVSKFKNDSAAVGCDSLSLCNNLGVGFAMIAVNYPGRPHRPLPSLTSIHVYSVHHKSKTIVRITFTISVTVCASRGIMWPPP
jgi:hypothetical protein